MKGIETFTLVLLILTLVIASYFLVLKLLGRSATALEILSTLVVALFIHSFRVENKLGQISEFASASKNSFRLVREDMKEMLKDMQEIKKMISRK